MNKEQEDRLGIAEDKLSTAKLLRSEGKYGDAISRAYYSMFHSAKALLLEKDSDPKTHSGVSTELGKLFREELGKEVTRDFSRIQEKREKADYGEVSDFSDKEAKDAIKAAETLLEKTMSFFGV